MLFDKQALLSDAQDIGALGLGASVNSTNVYDLWGQAAPSASPLGTPVFDVGRGEDLEFILQVIADITSAGAATVQFKVVMADTADLATNPVTLWDSGAIPKATLVAGYQARISCLPHGVSKRYLGLVITDGTAALTAGKITAGIVMDRQTAPGSIL